VGLAAVMHTCTNASIAHQLLCTFKARDTAPAVGAGVSLMADNTVMATMYPTPGSCMICKAGLPQVAPVL